MNLEQQIKHYKEVKRRIAASVPKLQPILTDEIIDKWVENNPTFRDPRLKIVAQCAGEFNCTVADVFGPRKTMNAMMARRKAAYLLVQRKTTSITEVGRYLRRNHKTILHAVKMYEKSLAVHASGKEEK